MANSFQQWTWNTGDPLYRLVTVPYQSQAEMKLYDDGVEVSFSWDSSTQISFSAPESGSLMVLKRDTSIDTRKVDFEDGNSLSEEDLDTSAIQLFYKQQELTDIIANNITYDATTNKHDANNKVISNIANGVAAQDAVSVAQLTAAALGVIDDSYITDRLDTLESDLNTAETNITNLTSEKLDKSGGTMTGNLTVPDATQEGHAVNKGQLDEYVPAGKVVYFAMSTLPAGYLKCNGAEISRETYANLFNAIGTTFGAGDELTTFNLPDLRGLFIRGLGGDSAALGATQGDAIRNITGHIPRLSDTVFWRDVPTTQPTGVFSKGPNPGNDYGASQSVNKYSCCDGLEFDASTVVPTANENRPVNMALLACIKY